MPPRQRISIKMHAYRDALPKCRGSYLVYPGDKSIMCPADGKEAGASGVARDGVGIIAARASSNLSDLQETVRALINREPFRVEFARSVNTP